MASKVPYGGIKRLTYFSKLLLTFDMSRYVAICILKNHTVYFKHASIRYLKYWRWEKGFVILKI